MLNHLRRNFVLLACLFLLAGCSTVTDPDDPRFNPKQFEFSHYDSDELKYVAKKIFPPGTSRQFVENILIRRGGAEITDYHEITTEQTFVTYVYDATWPASNQTVHVLYDGQGKVISTR